MGSAAAAAVEAVPAHSKPRRREEGAARRLRAAHGRHRRDMGSADALRPRPMAAPRAGILLTQQQFRRLNT